MQDYDTLWKGKFVRVISPKEYPYECLGDGNGILVIPFKGGKIGVRSELCPPYLVMDDTGNTHYYTLITGGVEGDETPQQGMERELLEEAGISFTKAQLTTLPAIPIFKNLASHMHIFLLELEEYTEVEPLGDGTEYEAQCQTLWLTKEEIADIVLTQRNYDMLFLMAHFLLGSYNVG